MFGFGRKGVVYDLSNARHVVLQTRNLFEAINVREVNGLMEAKEKGCKLTDYAFNLAVIHSRSISIIDALLGSVGAKGGLPLVNKPGDYDRKGLNKLMDL